MLKKYVMLGLLAASPVILAQGDDSAQTGGNDSQQLSTYLKNLGKYFGYDITNYCTTGGQCSSEGVGGSQTGEFNNQLINPDMSNINISLVQSYLNSLMGLSQTNPLVSDKTDVSFPLYSQTFVNPPYNTYSKTGISVSPKLDQVPYQNDPVSQAVLNIISTPGTSYCMDSTTGRTWTGCKSDFLFSAKVSSQVIGTLPNSDMVYSGDYNSQWLAQLNADQLISPLLYTTENIQGGSPTDSNSLMPVESSDGLQAKSQAQQASNFIRYASGLVTPLELPPRLQYDRLFFQALKGTDEGVKVKSAGILSRYIAELRTFSSQVSVGIGNLYYLLSKRIPQKSLTGNSQGSQALDEFKMATWRLYGSDKNADSSQPQNKPWLDQINKASNATVQKEVAVLLAEINYQLYLNRQMQERQLLTDSILLFQNAKNTRPEADLGMNTTTKPMDQNE